MRASPVICTEPVVIEGERRHSIDGDKIDMAPGATLIVRTQMGDAEATRMEGAQAGQNCWSIQYPWGSETHPFQGVWL